MLYRVTVYNNQGEKNIEEMRRNILDTELAK